MTPWLESLKSFGFPAVVSAFYIWNECKSKKRLEDRVETLEKENKELMVTLLNTINRNTEAMKSLENLILKEHVGAS